MLVQANGGVTGLWLAAVYLSGTMPPSWMAGLESISGGGRLAGAAGGVCAKAALPAARSKNAVSVRCRMMSSSKDFLWCEGETFSRGLSRGPGLPGQQKPAGANRRVCSDK
jgi:hypothetical protein